MRYLFDEDYRIISRSHRDALRLFKRHGGFSYEHEAGLLSEHLRQHVHPALFTAAEKCAHQLLRYEDYIFSVPPIEYSDDFEYTQLRHRYRRIVHFYFERNPPIQILRTRILGLVRSITDHVHSIPEPGPFSLPLIETIDVHDVAVEILSRLHGVGEGNWLLSVTQSDFFTNTAILTGVNLHQSNELELYESAIEAIKDLPASELRKKFFASTLDFEALAQFPIPINLTYNDRFSHMHIVGGTGAGKTTLLESLIDYDLKNEQQPALVVVDSQGDLIRKISRLQRWETDDRFLLITPKDVTHPPALNIFDLNRDRLGTYDEATREQVTAGVIQTFDYLFTGLVGADLTAKQGVFFKYVARLMLSLPDTLGRNATILDMLRLMEDPTPYLPAIRALPDIPRDWFERDFAAKNFSQTKEQIRYRLHAIIENPTLARLFTSPSTKVDLFSEINRGSVILVDTAKDFLKGSSGHFGRIFISLVLQAVLERAAIPEGKRRPAFLIVDEAAEYFDSNIDDLLTEARKQKLGCVFAHQYLDQATSSLRASFAANTGIKFAGGVSMSDARAMAADMRTTPEFILNQPRLHFAAHIRNSTTTAVSIPVEIGTFSTQPRLSDDAFATLMERNRARVSLGATPPTPPLSPPPDEDVSETW